MKRIFSNLIGLVFVAVFFFSNFDLHGQMWNEELQDTLYGNEWIDFENANRYLKIDVTKDGFYKIKKSDLPSFWQNTLSSEFQLFLRGQEMPISSTAEGILSDDDYLIFYGKKNRSEFDKFLFEDPHVLLNPEYSMYSDTASYYLTYSQGNHMRYNTYMNEIPQGVTPLNYHIYEEKVVFSEFHQKQYFKAGSAVLKKSFYDAGEGWGSNLSTNQTFSIQAPTPIDNGNGGVLKIRFATYSDVEHDTRILLNGDEIYDVDNHVGFKLNEVELEVNSEMLQENISVNIKGNSSFDGASISVASLSYQSRFDAQNQSYYQFELGPSNVDRYVFVDNFDLSGGDVLSFDVSNHRLGQAMIENNQVKILIPSTSQASKIVLISSGQISNLDAVPELISFVDLKDKNAEFLILTHSYFFDAPDGTNPIADYANYRRTNPYNNYEVEVADVLQIYEQFGFGIYGHPQSIRNFAHFVKKHWENMEYCFLIGKARIYKNLRNDDIIGDKMYVPTFGEPGSDNMLFSTNTTSTPIFSIARLTTTQHNPIRNYLNKVTQFEATNANPQTIEDWLWQKRAIHLSGGGPNEQETIKGSLDAMAQIYESSKIGGEVTSYYKESSDIVVSARSQEIRNLINTGVKIVNFFGHSSPTNWDFNIEAPEEYNNDGKYFLLISNGCFSGQCHNSSQGIGEKFIHAQNKGGIAYYASTGYGYISALNFFSNGMYSKLGGEYYGKGLGDIFRAMIAESDPQTQSYSGLALLSQQNTLQCDPAIRLFNSPGADYIVNPIGTNHSPLLINTQLDSFNIEYSIANLGENITNELPITITQLNPSGEKIQSINTSISSPGYQEDYNYFIPIVKDKDIIGINTFLIEIDSTNLIEELPAPQAENNNKLVDINGQEGYKVLIVSNDLIPIYPTKYGIVNNQNLILKASSSNAFADQQEYKIQIDTTQNFNSPILKTTSVIQSGGIITWQPELNYLNNTVYYWRTTPVNTPDGEPRWISSSFLYLNTTSDGWNQSHYYQFQEDNFSTLEITASRNFNYAEDYKDLVITNGYRHPSSDIWYRPCMSINGNPIDCNITHYAINSLRVIVLDPSTLDPVTNSQIMFGSEPATFFRFDITNSEGRLALRNFLNDSIPDNYYVSLQTILNDENGSIESQTWEADTEIYGTNLFEVLQGFGATLTEMLVENHNKPYTYFFKKADLGFPSIEFFVEDEPIDRTLDLIAKWDEGSIFSTKIGPAKSWNELQWYAEFEENEFGFFNLYGYNNQGQKSLIESNIIDQIYDISHISSEDFPNLQLEFYSQDSILRTAPNLDYMRILYEIAPEAGWNPSVHFSINNDTLQRGEHLHLELAYTNLNNIAMDSMLVHFIVQDERNNRSTIIRTFSPLLESETDTARVEFDTKLMSGNQNLLIQLNPNYAQPEQTNINNNALLPFFIQNETQSPFVDVTFDGEHILNNDIVSPNPYIVISILDENPYLPLNDTTAIELYLSFPNGNLNKIYFTNENLSFTPAIEGEIDKENKITINFNPDLQQDGIYTLMIRNTQDVSGNQPSNFDYKINFEVINKLMISNVINYPNPFTTSTRFVYTLTGREIPTRFKIQIMSISGRIVRELGPTDLGTLQIGTHLTKYAWNGTDQYGDKLANGIYLYRFIAEDNQGNEIEKYASGVDKYFDKGFGKMVIIK